MKIDEIAENPLIFTITVHSTDGKVRECAAIADELTKDEKRKLNFYIAAFLDAARELRRVANSIYESHYPPTDEEIKDLIGTLEDR